MVGTFKTPVVDTALQEVGKNGTPAIVVRFTVEGQDVYANLFLTDAALDRTMKTAKEVLGWNGEDLGDFNAGKFNGKEVSIVCEEDQYGTKVKWINSIDGNGGAVRSMKKDPDLAAKLKSKIMAYRTTQSPVSDGLNL